MPTRDECLAAFAASRQAARQERDELAACAGGGWAGAVAVAQTAHPRDPEAAALVARKYFTWMQEELAKRDAGSET